MKKANVLLVGAEDEENLALRYLASCLEKEGHSVRIVSCSRIEEFPFVIKAVSRFNPDLIAVSIAFQSLAIMYFELIKKIRESGFRGHLTVGGHFPTFEFKKILETQKGIDSVVRFEGEQPIVELANYLVGRNNISSVHNLVYRKDGKLKENECICEFQSLDELPFPKRSNKQQVRLGENFATLVASRGCWHSRCLFCCIGAFHSKKTGKKFALRNPESIAEEIKELYSKFRVRLFQFHDDNFLLPTPSESCERLFAIKKAIESKGIDINNVAFLIKARPDSIDERVAIALKELGAVGVFLGVENASETGLKALIRGTKLKEVHASIKALEKNGIVVTFNLLVFHPNATLKEIKQNIGFMKKYFMFPFDFGRAEIVAGSPLEKIVVNTKKLNGEWPKWSYTLNDRLAEKIFQVNLRTFRRNDSPYTQLIHSNIALAYNAFILKRLHKGKISDELASESNKLIKKVNSFIIKKIERILELGLNNSNEKEIENFYNELAEGCNNYHYLISQLSTRMARLAITEKVFERFKVKEFAQEIPLIRRIFSF